MNRRTQHRSWILGIHGRAAGAALALAIMLVAAVLATGSAQAQTYTESVLYSFEGSPDGAFPVAGLARDAQGNLYGTTEEGGNPGACPHYGRYDCGTVFKVDTTGKETVLYSFTGGADGANPHAGLVPDAQGNLYGTTYFGGDPACVSEGTYGCGTVFKLDTSGNETVLHSFAGHPGDGANPEAGLVRDAQGNLYGTTLTGGSGGPELCSGVGGCGTVFKLDTTSKETVLYSFTGVPDGEEPDAGLVRDAQGNLYGTTYNGGASNLGTVFELDTTGKETVLHSFTGTGGDGSEPYGGLVLDAQGNLYGTTSFGGASGDGTVFELDTAGKETVLYSFTGTGGDGAYPSGLVRLVRDAQGNLYGTTYEGGDLACDAPYGCGTVFKLTPAAATKTTTALMSSRNPSTYGQAVTFTAAVTSKLGAPPNGETVTFMEGTAVLGTGPLSGGSASFTILTLKVGSNAIKAVYGGDSNFAASTSNTVSQVVSKAGSSVSVVSSKNPAAFGASVTFTATVKSTTSGTPTGTVTFKDGGATLGTGTLNDGRASFRTAELAVGSHSITAVYGGSTIYKGSTSPVLTQKVVNQW